MDDCECVCCQKNECSVDCECECKDCQDSVNAMKDREFDEKVALGYI